MDIPYCTGPEDYWEIPMLKSILVNKILLTWNLVGWQPPAFQKSCYKPKLIVTVVIDIEVSSFPLLGQKVVTVTGMKLVRFLSLQAFSDPLGWNTPHLELKKQVLAMAQLLCLGNELISYTVKNLYFYFDGLVPDCVKYIVDTLELL